MKRRSVTGGTLTAEQLVGEFDRLLADHPVNPRAIRAGLEAVGHDPVSAIRARRWLKHGRPTSWRWDVEEIAAPRLTDPEPGEWTGET